MVYYVSSKKMANLDFIEWSQAEKIHDSQLQRFSIYNVQTPTT